MEKKVYVLFRLLADSVLLTCRVYSSLAEARGFVESRVIVGDSYEDYMIVTRDLL